jgi:LPPG:FO 2-phospho-L-lactate transferase
VSVVTLCGGVGGAKLAFGLDRLLGRDLQVIVNTGDDFEHLGLTISPDIDTVLYTLAGLANPVLGWGRADESWNFMDALAHMGGENWFRLGDRDLVLHVERTWRLRAGQSLTDIVAYFAARLGLQAKILPMCDDPIRTIVATDQGTLPFQRYFVEQRCAPRVSGISFEGLADARASGRVLAALRDPAIEAIVVCPSNPFLSVDPILAAPGIRDELERRTVPMIVVSPIIGGKAVKGPTDKIMAELGISGTTLSIASHYNGLMDGLVIDRTDAADRDTVNLPVLVTDTLMRDDADRTRLAGEVLEFAARIGAGPFDRPKQ